MTNMIAETAFKLFGEFKDPLLSNTMTAEDYDKQALHSLLQGMVIINECTGVAHGLGYPLSYYYHVPHGLACGIFEGEYVKIYKDQKRVKRIMDAIGFNTVDEFCSYIQKILAPHIRISVTAGQIEEWTQNFCKTQWRLDRHPYPLTEDMVRDIYYRSLSVFITDTSSFTKIRV